MSTIRCGGGVVGLCYAVIRESRSIAGMTFRGLLQSRIDPGGAPGTYKNITQLANALGLTYTRVQAWVTKGSEPRGGFQEMLDIANKLGIPEDEALRLIREPDFPPPLPPPDLGELLVTELHMPEDVAARIMQLDRDDPEAWRAAWAAAAPTLVGMVTAMTGRSSARTPESR